ncbi:MAG: hypothetical protein D6820_08210 [Lentisphaerae bacterium]|nr:MAG: hypothetical protein D6820_08210 [Lentisphaerota bacterium]
MHTLSPMTISEQQPILNLPVTVEAEERDLFLFTGSRFLSHCKIRLAAGCQPDYWVFLDLRSKIGQQLLIRSDHDLPELRNLLRWTREPVTETKREDEERLRPRYHFTTRRGWLNDPNGLIWHDGQYHLYYQHNPFGTHWGAMHWGHATSPDLIHWQHHPIAMYPHAAHDFCFSGSIILDASNRTGLGSRNQPPLLAFFTSTGRGECMRYSLDHGFTWHEYGANPVWVHSPADPDDHRPPAGRGRDPRVFYHSESAAWIMVTYEEAANGEHTIVFCRSEDLLHWRQTSAIAGFYECPECFPLFLENGDSVPLWVLWGADGSHYIGDFDGHRFDPRTPVQRCVYGDWYAAQTYTTLAPGDGRRVAFAWLRTNFPSGVPFNQQMTIPVCVGLRGDRQHPRLIVNPVEELEKHFCAVEELCPQSGDSLRTGCDAGRWRLRLCPGESSSFTYLEVGQTRLAIEWDTNTLIFRNERIERLTHVQAPLKLDIFWDRASVEIFVDHGDLLLVDGGVIAPAKLGVLSLAPEAVVAASHIAEWCS